MTVSLIIIVSLLTVILFALLPLPVVVLWADVISDSANQIYGLIGNITFPFFYLLGTPLAIAIITLFIGLFTFDVAWHTFWFLVSKVPFLQNLFNKYGG